MGFFQPAPPAAAGGLSQASADALYDPLGAAAAAQAAAVQRANHTGTQAAATVLFAATARILGRITASGGAGEELTAANVKTILALVAADISDLTEVVEDLIGGKGLGGSGLTFTYTDASGAMVLDVNVDGSTVEVSADALRVKDAGITRAKLATAIAKDTVEVQVTDLTTALAVADGLQWWVVPSTLNGLKLVGVEMGLTVAQSTSGIPTIQIANVTQAWDMLTTKLTVDANEWHSSTAATAAVIDTASSHDVLTTGDRIRFDCDVAGTGAKGVFVSLLVGS